MKLGRFAALAALLLYILLNEFILNGAREFYCQTSVEILGLANNFMVASALYTVIIWYIWLNMPNPNDTLFLCMTFVKYLVLHSPNEASFVQITAYSNIYELRWFSMNSLIFTLSINHNYKVHAAYGEEYHLYAEFLFI